MTGFSRPVATCNPRRSKACRKPSIVVRFGERAEPADVAVDDIALALDRALLLERQYRAIDLGAAGTENAGDLGLAERDMQARLVRQIRSEERRVGEGGRS